MFKREEEIRDAAVLAAVEEVMLAVRTAPKTRGYDNVAVAVATGDHKEMLAAKMDEIFERSGGKRPTFARDAKNVMAAPAVLLVAVKAPAYGLDCGWCGFPSCAEKPGKVPCVFGGIDLGIAGGVASARLADKFIDNRMMYSIGRAAQELNLFGPETAMVLGFPLSVSCKNPFFDRK